MTHADAPDLNGPSETIARIAPIVPTIFDALDHGLLAAETIHRQRSYAIDDDKNFYAYCVRREARQRLERAGLFVSLEDDGVPAPNLSGLLLHHGTDVLKVRRAAEGEVPTAGSDPAAAYYKQESMFPGMASNNLLLLWTSEDGKVVEPARLVKPSWGDKHRKRVLLDWDVPLLRVPAARRASDLDDILRRKPDSGTAAAADSA